MPDILLLNGPNLNRLGAREPERYGHTDLPSIETRLTHAAETAGLTMACRQSNSEATLIDRIHAAADEGVRFIIFNPAAFTHTSIALRDALLAAAIPFVEVHLSNVHARESFRHHSYFSDIAAGVVTGFGALGYDLAFSAALHHIRSSP